MIDTKKLNDIFDKLIDDTPDPGVTRARFINEQKADPSKFNAVSFGDIDRDV